jgi:toluene monooxygenase electron transfer component
MQAPRRRRGAREPDPKQTRFETMKITIRANSGDFSFPCEADQRLLYAGLTHGLHLPYECATGTCGTCRCRIVEGSCIVEWNEAPGFARLRREKGDVLMCQARPTADLIVRVPANVAALSEAGRPLPRRGRIGGVRRLNEDVMDFDVSVSPPMSFHAGQFVVVEVAGVEGGRAYSMVNFGGKGELVKLLVKRKPDGRLSDWLFGSEIDGREVNVFGPLGRATFHPEERRNILCVAGGSGIAGMLSILAHAVSEDYFRQHRGYVFFGVRSLADAFYLDQLCAHVATAGGNLTVTLALSHEEVASDTHPRFAHLRLAHGMVSTVMAGAMQGRFDNLVSFVAGPTPMVEEALRVLIRGARQPPLFVRYDKFA